MMGIKWPKHVETDKYTKNKLCTQLVLFTRPVILSLLAFSIADIVPENYNSTTRSETSIYIYMYSETKTRRKERNDDRTCSVVTA
jgi:hypothetical protein